MLKSCLLHPEILEALGRAGHSSKILIADGNYRGAAAVCQSLTPDRRRLPGERFPRTVNQAIKTLGCGFGLPLNCLGE